MSGGMWVLTGVERRDWWSVLQELEGRQNVSDVLYRRLFRALAEAGHESLPVAMASELLFGESLLPRGNTPGDSLREALERDVARLSQLARRDWRNASHESLPPLAGLAPAAPAPVRDWADRLAAGTADTTDLLAHFARHDHGPLARHSAFTWQGEGLHGVERVTADDHASLYGLEHQLGRLRGTVEAWLDGGPRHNVLLYGPRGSGKSTAARGLLRSYADRGLRLVEVAPADLATLPRLLERIEESPLRFVIFVDDLGYGSDDSSFRHLKTLLEGTVRAAPANALLLATTNRRNIVAQRFSDRPDPLDDDVHGWDTENDRLALVDRFAHVITFPPADQRRYLQLVEAMARERGVYSDDVPARAVRHADQGNGYSGRTARQFVDGLGR